MNTDKATELFEAQAHLYRHIYGYHTAFCLKWAIQSGIPDIIHNHGQPVTLPELVSALQVPPPKVTCVHRIMRLLAHNGFFAITKSNVKKDEDEEEEAYVLTPPSELLVKGSDYCLSSMVEMAVKPSDFGRFEHFGKWMHGEEATLEESACGVGYYDFLNDNPANLRLFNEAMASDSRIVKLAFRDGKAVFEGLDSMVDVGGGNGSTAQILSEAFPNMKCIVLDRPKVVANLSDSNNLSYVAGDMFKFIPQADAVLLKWILHNWSDDDCVKILTKCKEAISGKNKREKGKVIIIDIVINEKEDDYATTETKLLFDVLMMTMFNGKERNEREFAELFLKAGFKDYKIFPIFGFRSLIELFP